MALESGCERCRERGADRLCGGGGAADVESFPIVKRESLSRSGVRWRVRAPRPRERSEEWNAHKKSDASSLHMRHAQAPNTRSVCATVLSLRGAVDAMTSWN
jgi:hypothetical protein